MDAEEEHDSSLSDGSERDKMVTLVKTDDLSEEETEKRKYCNSAKMSFAIVIFYYLIEIFSKFLCSLGTTT